MAEEMTAAEARAEADAQDLEETEALQASAAEFIEYLGQPGDPHGTAFLTAHTIPKGDGLWKRAGVTVSKDITWERDPNAPIGQKGQASRMLLPVADLPEGALAVLEKTPGYKRVSD